MSSIVAGIISFITTKNTFKYEIKRKIYDEREETYILLFNLIDQLRNNPFLVFNTNDFLKPLNEAKARANLYASQEVLDIIKPLNNKIIEISNEYFQKYCSLDSINYHDDCKEYEGTTDADLIQEEEEYIEQNVIDISFVENVLGNYVLQIRQELKIQ